MANVQDDRRPGRNWQAVHVLARTVTALLLLLVPSWVCAAAAGASSLTTILITPRPDLPDPNFNGSTVLVMNSLGAAPAGVILNRPTRIPVASVFPEIEKLAQLDDKIYFGGPVEISVVSFMFRAASPPEHAIEVVAGVYLSMNRDLLRQLLGRDRPMRDLRIFMGYAGWAPGQLEGEIRRGDWTLAPADAAAIFDRKSDRPWPANDSAEKSNRI